MNISKFKTHWGKVTRFELPTAIFNGDKLVISGHALAVLLIIYKSAKGMVVKKSGDMLIVKVSQRFISLRSGLSKDRITAAFKELKDRGFIIHVCNGRRKYGEFGSNSYQLCNPETLEPLRAQGSNFLYGNGLPYFHFPSCIVSETAADWSLAKMSSSEVKSYVSACWMANRKRSTQFGSTFAEVRKAANLSPVTFNKTLRLLEVKRIVAVEANGLKCNIRLNDPYTGELPRSVTANPYDDPANYMTRDSKHHLKRANINISPELAEALLLESLPSDVKIVSDTNGNIKIVCPFHDDKNPSCSVSVIQRGFRCFGCGVKGDFTDVLAKLRNISRGEAIKLQARAAGVELEFRLPDSSAEAIYSYLDETGTKLLKQVVRGHDEDGNKTFTQRRPSGNGWKPDVRGVKTPLYNAQYLRSAQTVIICEGEKDAETLMSLSLCDSEGNKVVAVTSGGADTWRDELANSLIGKKVIIMPDADEAGTVYQAHIEESLDQRNIEFRVVGFEDVGQKDVSDFLNSGHSVDELVNRIGRDWVMTQEEYQRSQFQEA